MSQTLDLISKLQAAVVLHPEAELVDQTGHPVLPETRGELKYLGTVKAALGDVINLAASEGIIKGFRGSELDLSGPDGLIVEVDKAALFKLIQALETLAP